jgi:hypothetical protein
MDNGREAGRLGQGAGARADRAAASRRHLGADGTWINEVGASKEDDPLDATPLVAGALALCRAAMPMPTAR